MFDLRLFRKPTFVGGSIAGFGMNGSLFAILLYLTLYLQDGAAPHTAAAGLRPGDHHVLDDGDRDTGRASLAAGPGAVADRAGLLLVGIGLLLMRGLAADSDWTVLLAGFLVAGAGAGIVNPPFASTAVGVVAPQDTGMASGINTTCRQVGIATAVADARHDLCPQPGRRYAGNTPRRLASTLNELLLISACVAFVAGALSFALIRQRDFVAQEAPVAAQQLGSARKPVDPLTSGPALAKGGRPAGRPPTDQARSAAGRSSGDRHRLGRARLGLVPGGERLPSRGSCSWST